MGAEIWGWVAWASRPRSCDPPPTDPSELSFLSVDTRTPYAADFPGEDLDTVRQGQAARQALDTRLRQRERAAQEGMPQSAGRSPFGACGRS
jgi:hypothetical protein